MLNTVKHWNISNLLKIALAPRDMQMLPKFLCLDVACDGRYSIARETQSFAPLPFPEMH